MKKGIPKRIFLKDYEKPKFLITKTDLTFDLYEEFVEVSSRLSIQRNPENLDLKAPLVLMGEKLELLSLHLNQTPLKEQQFTASDRQLEVHSVPDQFILEVRTKIFPDKNTTLEGLYRSSGNFCTQNEPEGFRKMTYFADRPDVMSRFSTTIRADQKKYPILLSNGNEVEKGELDEGRHWVRWVDPFPKPAYLFALVAGDLACVEDEYITASGRKVRLRVFVDHGNENRCDHAIRSLKNAMKWDEEKFGLEYDLNDYMIVAVNDFNFGAMENKGLNIFNSSYVLANPQTATDQDYQGIEAVIGHEYFHNWTGNRVTLRDWFQLTLKEGLTVFRDQEFSSDMGSRAVKRIEDVSGLRRVQFQEDSGPMAHPIRPDSYIEVNNFYTPTVYEKGAEVIRMLHTLMGAENFRKGMDHYFKLYDGKAITTEDFLKAMQDVSAIDLSQFQHWYHQAGTPKVTLKSQHYPKEERFEVTLEQHHSDPNFKPFFIPFKLGIIHPETKKDETHLLHFREKKQSFSFECVPHPPILSGLREFSAPVILDHSPSFKELNSLLENDSDSFNRYDAAQKIAKTAMLDFIEKKKKGEASEISSDILLAFKTLAEDDELETAFRAEALQLPSLALLLDDLEDFDIETAHWARTSFKQKLASAHQSSLTELYQRLHQSQREEITGEEIGKRRLKNTLLGLLSATQSQDVFDLAYEQFSKAKNMTDEMNAFSVLCESPESIREESQDQFHARWKNEYLVMNKWFAVQAASQHPETFNKVLTLQNHPLFDLKNPNRVRALFGAFARNLIHFHRADGKGYELIADKIIELNSVNPSVAAGLAKTFNRFSRLDTQRKMKMKAELLRTLEEPNLSKDVYEVLSKTLEQGG
jgi:aminopeptidase N